MTDIESSTRLFRELGDTYRDLLGTHHRLLSEAFQAHGGVEVETEGDALVIAFADQAEAVAGCVAAQLALQAHPWPTAAVIKVRMGVHTTNAEPIGDGYVTLGLHQAARICAAGHGGQVLLSETTASQVGGRLPAGIELTLLGSFQLRGFAEPARLFQATHAELQSQFPPLRVQGVVRHNLPFTRSAFVGRARERASLATMVRNTGIVTIVGVGGVGKTRLAVQVAFDLIDDFDDGAWLVELTSARDRRGVVGAVASALSLGEAAGRSLEDIVVDGLSAKAALLVLDNCEQVLEPVAAFVEELTRRSPHLVVVATSREPLAIEGEVICRLEPMPVPRPGTDQTEVLRQADAVRLFEERAGMANPGFRVTDANADAVATIVRQVDGIPLAVELAAAALADHSLGGVVEGLQDRFQLLTSGRRAAPPRHRTLRAALEWSLDLLTAQERVLFARLATFAHSGDIAAAGRVCSAAPLAEREVPLLLRRLVRASLVSLGEDERWSMLDSVKDLAALELSRVGGDGDLAGRHREYFLDRVEALGPTIGLRGRSDAMAGLAADGDNIRLALATGAAAGDADVTLRIAAAMVPFWTSHGDWTAGISHLRDALAVAGGTDVNRARALAGLGSLLILRGAIAEAESALVQADALRCEQDETTLARTASGLGYVAFRHADLEGAERQWREALEHADRAGDERVSAGILRSLAIAAGSRGDQVEAGRLLDQGIRYVEHARDDQLLRLLLGTRAEIDLWTGHYDAAQEHYGQALELASVIGDLSARPLMLCELGWVALLSGDLPVADRLASEAIELAEDLGNRRALGSALRLRGEAMVRRSDFQQAEQDLGRALEVMEGLSAPAEVAGVLCSQAYEALERREFPQAHRLAIAALERTTLGHAMRTVSPLWILGVVALAGGDLPEAERQFRAGAEHRSTGSAPRHLANSRWGLAWVSAASGQEQDAARLHGAALRMRAAMADRLAIAESLMATAAVLVAQNAPAAAQLTAAAESLRRACGAVPTPRQAAQEATAASLLARGEADDAHPSGDVLDEQSALQLATQSLQMIEHAGIASAGERGRE